MIINSLHIDGFGKLTEESFNFSPGLNLIFGPNEAGKSTMQRAILMLLYGFYNGSRPLKAERELHIRYKPWGGTAYRGSININLEGGQHVLISRSFDSDEPEAQLFDGETGEEITNQYQRKRRGYVDFCERQLSMSLQVFEAIACVPQGQLTNITTRDAQNISDAIIRLIDSAGTNISVRNAMDRLASASRAIGNEKSKAGPIFKAIQVKNETLHLLKLRNELNEELEAVYKTADAISDKIVQYNREEASLLATLEIIERDDLKSKLAKHATLTEKREQIYQRLQIIGDGPTLLSDQRDKVIQLIEERKILAGGRRDLLDEISAYEVKRSASRTVLQEFTVEQEFWSSPERHSFYDLKREWEQKSSDFKEGQSSQDYLTDQIKSAGLSEDVYNKLINLDSHKVEELQSTAKFIKDKEEELETLEDELEERSRVSSIASRIVGFIMFVILLFSLGAQKLPDSIFAGIIQVIAPSHFIYLVAGIAFIWFTIKATLALHIRSIREETNSIHEDIDELVSDQRRSLDSYGVKSYENLFDLKLKYHEIQKNNSAASELQGQLNKLEEQLAPWCQRFELKTVSRESLNNIHEILHQGQHHWNYIQEINGKLASMDIALEQRDDQLAKVTIELKEILQENKCWTGSIDRDVETFLQETKASSERESLVRELELLNDHEQELLGDETVDQLEEMLATVTVSVAERGSQGGNVPKNDLIRQINHLREERQEMELQFATAQKTIVEREARLPNLSEIEETLVHTESEIKELTHKRRALELAFDTLRDLSNKVHRDYAPRLATLANRSLRRATNGRYNEIYIDPSDFSIRIAQGASKTLVAVQNMSFGTQEIIYLFLRAAVADLLSLNAEPIPIFLDDPFAHADEERMEGIMNAILELSKRHQFFLFTKDRAVIDMLSTLRVEYNLTMMQDRSNIPRRWAAGSATRPKIN